MNLPKKIIEENELTRKYFPFLDGLRAIAIFWVILHHLPIGLPDWLEQIRIRGDLGVELFFAISSFLVFRSLHQCFSGKSLDKFEFIKRRIFRIFPPYFLTLILILILSFIDKGLGEKVRSIQNILLSFPLFFYNYAQPFTTGTVPGVLHIFWSLCFEEQFYIAIFLISLGFFKKINIFIICGILFSISLRIFYYYTNKQYTPYALQIETHLRLDAILFGCLFYYYWDSLKKYFDFLAINLLLVFFATCLHRYIDLKYKGILYIFISLSFSSLVFNLLNKNENWLVSLLQHKILTKIGIVSFEIYLLHEMFIGLAVKLGLQNSPFLFIVVVYALSIGSSLIMHKMFSSPINVFLRNKFIRIQQSGSF